jgi:hypothetical protein
MVALKVPKGAIGFNGWGGRDFSDPAGAYRGGKASLRPHLTPGFRPVREKTVPTSYGRIWIAGVG